MTACASDAGQSPLGTGVPRIVPLPPLGPAVAATPGRVSLGDVRATLGLDPRLLPADGSRETLHLLDAPLPERHLFPDDRLLLDVHPLLSRMFAPLMEDTATMQMRTYAAALATSNGAGIS